MAEAEQQVEHQRRNRRRSAARSRRVRTGAVLAAAIAAAIGVGIAGAADPSLEEKIESAESEAGVVSDRIDARSAKLAELDRDSRRAGARAMELAAQVERSAGRSNELARRLLQEEEELDGVQARLDRAVGVLSERLVAIYKGDAPDYLTLILDADGFEDLESRAAYLDALHEADADIADRVRDLRDEAAEGYERVAATKAEVDAATRRLDVARAEAERASAAAEARAAELDAALAAEEADLGEIRDRIASLEAEQAEQAEQQAGGGGGDAFFGGPYSIPTYIVMCESGGNYRALNPSSMAGGAYQIIPSTWAAYGGKGPYAHLASKAEQDRVAALIWADVGASAWSCA